MLKNGKIVAKGVPKKVLNAENLKNTFQVKLPKGGFKPLQLAD
jgi:ABC-type cobalamin/Fe3+-siderophores transport system ATPase subunit